MKIIDIIKKLEQLITTDNSKIIVYMKASIDGVLGTAKLSKADILNNNVVFISDDTNENGITASNLLSILKEKQDISNYTVYSRYIDEKTMFEVTRVDYVNFLGDKYFELDIDENEFKKTEKSVEEFVIWSSSYNTVTDSKKELLHILKSLDLSLSRKKISEIIFNKNNNKFTANFYIYGKKTNVTKFIRKEYMRPDKETYIRLNRKW